MSNSQEKRVTRTALVKGYRLDKVGKGPHHGRFSMVSIAEASRVPSGVSGADFTFSLEEAEAWLAQQKVPARP